MAGTPKPIGRILIIPRGDYDLATPYNSLDLVRYDKKTWLCKTDGIIGVTPSEGTDWTCIVVDGLNGTNGTDGADGNDGRGITSIQKTGTDPSNPLKDIYTITYTDGTTSTFTVTNGASGSGAGDMLKSVYDTNGDGIVDNADHATTATTATTANKVGNADTSLLEKLTDSYGKLNYNGNALMLEAAQFANQAKLGEFVVNQISNNVKELALHSNITTKLSKVDNKIDKPASATEGQVLTYRNNEWVADDSQGGGQFVIIAKGETYEGQTVTATKGTKSKSAVITSGVARIPVDEGGVWTLTLSSGETWNTPNMTYYGEYEVVLGPHGSIVTPTDNIQIWLKCAELNESYTSISQVLADTNTLSALISDNNASDYLARSTTWASDVCSNESAMIYIGLNDYCANKLLADSTWCTAICDSPHFEKVLNKSVPTLISNTGPDGGKAFCSEAITNYEAYKAFNNKTDLAERFVAPTNATNIYLGYTFPKNINVKKVEILTLTDEQEAVRINALDFEFNLAYSDNGTNYNILDELYSVPKEKAKEKSKFPIFNNNYAKYWKINFIGNTSINVSASQEFTQVYILQFYGREEA